MRETAQQRFKRTAAVFVALALVLSVFGPVGTVAAVDGITVSQQADSSTVNPGDTVTFTTSVSVDETQIEANSIGLQTDLPSGWELVERQDGTSLGAGPDGWLWFSTTGVSGADTVQYTVAVPDDAASGDYTVSATAATEGGESTTEATTLAVEQPDTNEQPTVSITGPSSAEVGQEVSFTAVASDDGSIASYAWDFDGDDQTDATGASAVHTFDATGSYDVEVTVTDDEGATATATQTVSVSAAPDPANFDVSALNTPGTVTQGDTATITATVQNTGDEEDTQTVSLSVNGTQVDSQQVTLAGDASQEVGFSVDTSGLAVGPQTIEVSTDDDTATGAMFVDAATEPPAGPVDVGLEPADQTAAPGDTVTYDVVVSGADGVGSFEGLTVSVSNSGTASIVGASTPASDGTEEIVVDDQSVTVTAFGLPNDSSGQVTIATITVSADAAGETDLTIADDGDLFMSDQQGSGYTIGNTTDATLSVGLPPVVGDESPANLDDDKVLEDVNGDGEFNVGDAQALFYNRDSAVVQENAEYFDFNGDGIVNVGDAQAIFYEVAVSEN